MEETTCTGECHSCKFDKEEDYITPTVHGYSGDRESGCKWAVFTRSDEGIDDVIAEAQADNASVAEALTGWWRSYGGPGRVFTDDPYAVIGKYHVLVKQGTGLDI